MNINIYNHRIQLTTTNIFVCILPYYFLCMCTCHKPVSFNQWDHGLHNTHAVLRTTSITISGEQSFMLVRLIIILMVAQFSNV